MLSPSDLDERINSGWQMLADIHGEDWFHGISVAQLDIRMPSYCILGQVYGNYHDARRQLEMDGAHAAMYGFDLMPSEINDDGIPTNNYSLLQTVWKEKIQEAQNAGTH